MNVIRLLLPFTNLDSLPVGKSRQIKLDDFTMGFVYSRQLKSLVMALQNGTCHVFQSYLPITVTS